MYKKALAFKPTFPDNLSRDQLIEMCRTSSDEVNAGIMELATIGITHLKVIYSILLIMN